MDISGLFKSIHIFTAITPFFTNIISFMKSPSLIIVSPLIDIIGYKEVATFTIKSEL